MIGRREFGVVGVSMAVLAALEGTAAAQPKRKRTEHAGEADEMFEDCAEACSECERECEKCSSYCARHVAGGHKDHLATLRTCRDCADVCAAAAAIVARGGPFARLICEACAEACAACGEECEKFTDDEMMKECAEECRECEKACREMIRHGKHDGE